MGRRQASARALGTPLGWTLAVCLEQDEDSAVLGFGVDTGGGFGVFDGDGDAVPRDGRLLQIHLRGCAATFSITNLCCIFFFFGLREAAQSSNFYFSFHNGSSYQGKRYTLLVMRFLRSIKLYEDERSFLVPMLSLLHLDTLQFPCDAQDCAMFNRFVIQTDFARVCLHYESYGEQPPLHYLLCPVQVRL